jgi:transposase-like protein
MAKSRAHRFNPEVRGRDVRLVREQLPHHPSQWAVISAIAPKLGCTNATLRRWLLKAEQDAGKRSGPTSRDADRLAALERENRELKRANDILRKPMQRATVPHRTLPERRNTTCADTLNL